MKCKHCKKDFTKAEMANHVRWNHLNNDNHSVVMSKIINARTDLRFGKLTSYEVTCKCGQKFEVLERSKLFPKKAHYFCSRSCANSRVWTDVDKQNKSKAAIQSIKVNAANQLKCSKIHINCKYCDQDTTNKVFCSSKCKTSYYFESLTLKQQYYQLAQFKFKLIDYPTKFDFNLIKQYGWYKAKNRGDNPNGINRDHMYSIADGLKNNIKPELIAHPANCRLLKHQDNLIKRSRSSITIQELKKRIKHWND